MADGPIISIEGLEKRFSGKNTDVFALRGIDLAIGRGDIFGIIGKSGAGKSTLVRCINMLERPTGGSVFFEGRDLCRLPEAALREARRAMGMIFQQFNLLMQRTALQNVCFPLELAGAPRDETRKRAEELLDMVGLANRMDAYPSQLSGGQKQRVAIARALATKPRVLLCDEATSALDPATTDSILALIKDINVQLGITAVVITHEMSVIEKICSHVGIISKGKIVEQGLVEEVFFHPQTEAARRLGLSQPALANKLRLLTLTAEQQQLCTANHLSERHARAALRLPESRRTPALEKMARDKMSVRQADRLVDQMLAAPGSPSPCRRTIPMVRDVRFFVNTLQHAVDLMTQKGIAATTHCDKHDGCLEYIVRIPVSSDGTVGKQEDDPKKEDSEFAVKL